MRIIVDSGHGGSDPGAVGPTGTREKDVTLTLGFLVKEYLEKKEHLVTMTRTTDDRITIGERTRMANRVQGDIFISIHVNGYHDPNANGTEVLYYPTSVKGKALAKEIQDALVEEIGLRNRGTVPRKDLGVLSGTKMPATLVEVAFVTNPNEEKLLQDPAFLLRAAKGIAQGIEAWIEKNEGR